MKIILFLWLILAISFSYVGCSDNHATIQNENTILKEILSDFLIEFQNFDQVNDTLFLKLPSKDMLQTLKVCKFSYFPDMSNFSHDSIMNLQINNSNYNEDNWRNYYYLIISHVCTDLKKYEISFSMGRLRDEGQSYTYVFDRKRKSFIEKEFNGLFIE